MIFIPVNQIEILRCVSGRRRNRKPERIHIVVFTDLRWIGHLHYRPERGARYTTLGLNAGKRATNLSFLYVSVRGSPAAVRDSYPTSTTKTLSLPDRQIRQTSPRG